MHPFDGKHIPPHELSALKTLTNISAEGLKKLYKEADETNDCIALSFEIQRTKEEIISINEEEQKRKRKKGILFCSIIPVVCFVILYIDKSVDTLLIIKNNSEVFLLFCIASLISFSFPLYYFFIIPVKLLRELYRLKKVLMELEDQKHAYRDDFVFDSLWKQYKS